MMAAREEIQLVVVIAVATQYRQVNQQLQESEAAQKSPIAKSWGMRVKRVGHLSYAIPYQMMHEIEDGGTTCLTLLHSPRLGRDHGKVATILRYSSSVKARKVSVRTAPAAP